MFFLLVTLRKEKDHILEVDYRMNSLIPELNDLHFLNEIITIYAFRLDRYKVGKRILYFLITQVQVLKYQKGKALIEGKNINKELSISYTIK